LFSLFYREGNGGKQFDQNFYNDLGYRRRRWNFGINVESSEERLERLEKLDKGVVAFVGTLQTWVDYLMAVTDVIRNQSSKLK